MKRELPLVLTAVAGAILTISHFYRHPALSMLSGHMERWGVIIAAFALAMAAVNLLRIHALRISRRSAGMINSIALISGLLGMAFFGIVLGTSSEPFVFLFQSVFTPAAAALFAMTAFNLASASYRAFRAKSAQAAVLLLSGVLLMLGRAPIGEVIWGQFPAISSWIMSVGNLAGSRGLMISIAIGTMGVSLRILTGIDRAHLGAD